MTNMAAERTRRPVIQGPNGRPERPAQTPQAEPPDAIQEAIDYGIDISMLKDNLALTPAERLRRHDMALDMVEMLQKAKRP